MRRFLPIAIVLGAALLTLGGAAALYRANKPQTLGNLSEASEEQKTKLHVRGYGKAPVTIEEYGDFQCPPCGALSEPLNQIERDFTGKVRLIFREFPLATHVFARRAAHAAEAAGLQGKFWEMHDLIYREQATWSKTEDPKELFLSYARMLKLDAARFEKDLESPAVKKRVDLEQQHGTSLGVTLTPTLFVNGRNISGKSLNPAGLRAAVEEELRKIPARP